MSLVLAGALLAYCLLIGWGADRLLSRAAWCTRHPRKALRLWQACGIATPLALISAALVLAHDLWENLVITIFHAHEPRVHALYAGSTAVSPWWNATALVVAVLIIAAGFDAVRRQRAAMSVRNRHRAILAVCGRPTADRDVYVVDAAEVAAYCVPGPGKSGQIIVTSAGRHLLTGAELSATVEHERAHLAQRHHLQILVAETLTSLLAPLGLLRNYRTQTRRLVEMDADDHAATRCGRETLASALLTVGAAAGHGPQPLSLTGSSTAERIRRLLDPVGPPATRTSAAARVAPLSLMLVPLAFLIVPAASLAGTHHFG